MTIYDSYTYQWPLTASEKAEQRRLIAEGQRNGWAVSVCHDRVRGRSSLLRSAPLEHISGPVTRVMIASGFLHKRNKSTTQETAA